MATLDITADVAEAPAGSWAFAKLGFTPKATPVRIMKPHRKAGQFVFIAVLLHWSKFVYSLDARLAFQKHLYQLHGKPRRPSQSFPRGRRTTDRLRGGNRFGPAGC